jgi:Ulp1 family protease
MLLPKHIFHSFFMYMLHFILHSFVQIYIPVLRNQHWTVYAVNRFHAQIDILDPQDWAQEDDQHNYHIPIFQQIRSRLDWVFQAFTDGALERMFDWTFPYVKVPKQDPLYDCGFFCMLFIEHYNPRTRVMEFEIDKVSNFIARLSHF